MGGEVKERSSYTGGVQRRCYRLQKKLLVKRGEFPRGRGMEGPGGTRLRRLLKVWGARIGKVIVARWARKTGVALGI